MKKIIGAIYKADQDFSLIQDGDRICVGVSGGKDSLLLLYALSLYQKNSYRIAKKSFEVVGIHLEMGFENMDFEATDQFLQSKGISLTHYPTNLYEILKLHKNQRDEIQCSLCSKLKKGAIVQAAKEYGCNKVAFAHHSDDAIETLLLNMIYGGRIATFTPAMYLSNTEMNFIRPFVYCFEEDIRNAVNDLSIPVVKSTCPNDGYTKRQEIKDLLASIYKEYPFAKQNFLTSLTNLEKLKLWVKGAQWQSDHN